MVWPATRMPTPPAHPGLPSRRRHPSRRPGSSVRGIARFGGRRFRGAARRTGHLALACLMLVAIAGMLVRSGGLAMALCADCGPAARLVGGACEFVSSEGAASATQASARQTCCPDSPQPRLFDDESRSPTPVSGDSKHPRDPLGLPSPPDSMPDVPACPICDHHGDCDQGSGDGSGPCDCSMCGHCAGKLASEQPQSRPGMLVLLISDRLSVPAEHACVGPALRLDKPPQLPFLPFAA